MPGGGGGYIPRSKQPRRGNAVRNKEGRKGQRGHNCGTSVCLGISATLFITALISDLQFHTIGQVCHGYTQQFT